MIGRVVLVHYRYALISAEGERSFTPIGRLRDQVSLTVGDVVEFDPQTTPHGLRAVNVRVTAPLIRRSGWPRRLPCLACGRLRLATSPAQRLHTECRQRASDEVQSVPWPARLR